MGLVALTAKVVVVVVDDETLVRMNAVEVLTDAGYDVVEAADAASALAILRVHTVGVDVLFTDIQMPGSFDGLELARLARLYWPWIAVLVASGRMTPALDEMPLGSRFLRKPYKFSHLIDHVGKLADARAAVRRPPPGST